VKADPDVEAGREKHARKLQKAEDVTAERANESKTRLANGELLQKILWIPVTRLTNMSNLDFIVLDCELLHTPWKNTRLGNGGLDKPSAKVGMRWVARLLVLLLALPQAKAKGVALP
jgi:hypothetical protein